MTPLALPMCRSAVTLPMFRDPEWSRTQTRASSSSTQISMKWLPPPRVPHWRAAFFFSLSDATLGRSASSAAASRAAPRGCASRPLVEADRDSALDRGAQPPELSLERRGRQGRLHGGHAAADVHADRRGADRPLRRDDASDGRAHAPVRVGHRRDVLEDEGERPGADQLRGGRSLDVVRPDFDGNPRVEDFPDRHAVPQPGPAGSFSEKRIMRSIQRSGSAALSGMSVRASQVIR